MSWGEPAQQDYQPNDGWGMFFDDPTGRIPANGWAYQASPDEEQDSGTDTDTSSDSGHEPIDMSEFNRMSQEEAVEQAFLSYRFHKRRWRRMMGKPVRKFRRFAKRFGYGRSKGRGRGFGLFGRPRSYSRRYLAEEATAYLKGQGKGGQLGSIGKGQGRRRNPRGRDGNIMACRVCGSEEHFAARCPARKGSGNKN